MKQVARDLLNTLKRERLALDWRKRQQGRAGVRVAIRDGLDGLPPSAYGDAALRAKSAALYQHVYEAYSSAGRSVYG